MKWFCLLALASGAWAQTLSGPASVTVGDPVFLRLADGVRPIAGVTLRVAGPATEVGAVAASALNLRAAPAGTVRGQLLRGDRVLIQGQTGDGWCEVAVSHGGTGYVACEYLDRTPYGQPLGTTDVDGRVVVPNFGVVPGRVTIEGGGASFTVQVQPLVYDQTSTVAPGMSLRSRRWVTEGDGPFSMQILEVDPREPNVFLLPVRARDRAVGTATTSSMAKRYGAVAAVNGGPFGAGGVSLGTYVIDEQAIAGNLTDRAALLRCVGGGLDVAMAAFRGAVTAGGATMALTGVNRARGAQDLILFQPGFGARTGTGPDGFEVVLDAAGSVRASYDGDGNAEIPADGQVLSGSGEGAAFLRRNLTAGFGIRLSPVVVPGCSAVDVVGGGPRLVANGRVDIGDDGFGNERLRTARTAFALTSRGTWLLVTLDGHPGMRVDEFAAELVSLGAVKAVNLDGGASTTMVVEDAVRNAPSDGTERAVSDAVLVFSAHDLESLRLVMDRVALDPGQMDPAAIEPLYQHLDNASAAFAADELERVRVEIEALRGEITQRSGGELTRAAVRVLVEATNAYLRMLPGIQQGLRARKPVR